VTDRREDLRAIFDVEKPQGGRPSAPLHEATGRETELVMHGETNAGWRIPRAKGHGNNFRSGQTGSTPIGHDRPAKKPIGVAKAAPSEGTRDVRPARQPGSPRHPPRRSTTSTGRRTETPQGDDDDDTLAKLLAASGSHLAVTATDGVRKNTTRGGRSMDRPRGRIPATPVKPKPLIVETR